MEPNEKSIVQMWREAKEIVRKKRLEFQPDENIPLTYTQKVALYNFFFDQYFSEDKSNES